jgi:hypothetical protein
LLNRLSFGLWRGRRRSPCFSDFESAPPRQAEACDTGTSSLERWYDEVRTTPFDQFSDGDLSRAVRQELYLEQLLPFAIARLQEDPLAGDLYDGELMKAVSEVRDSFWRAHAPLHAKYIALSETGSKSGPAG